MAQYRKKPVVIEAIQWDGTSDCADKLDAFIGKTIEVRKGKMLINTLEGTMTASVGDWIIKGISGEFYPCKPDIFESTYDSLEGIIVT